MREFMAAWSAQNSARDRFPGSQPIYHWRLLSTFLQWMQGLHA